MTEAREEGIGLVIEVPGVEVVARILDVQCGDSIVVIRQVMGRHSEEWTAYESGSNAYSGFVGKIDNAPVVKSAEQLVPWVADLVQRRERGRLARAALARQIDEKPHPVPIDDESAPDQG